MPRARRVIDYFKRPDFVVTAKEHHSPQQVEDPASASPLPEPSLSPSSFPSQAASPETPDGPASQLKRSLLLSTEEITETASRTQESSQSTDTASTLNLSQRVIKNGKEVVISSDGDDTDSIGSIEDPEDMLARFLPPKPPLVRGDQMDHETERMSLRSGRSANKKNPWSISQAAASVPMYKNTLDNLVTQAVDDNETEAGIAKLRAMLDRDLSSDWSSTNRNKQLHEGILATALEDDVDDGPEFQRLLDAVRRTEAFDLGKSWSFFDFERPIPPPPEFPRDSVLPLTYLGTLREPESRERAFHSGVVDFASSRNMLPDELITWIFYSIPTESRDNLRHAYCRALKHTAPERLESLIRPKDIKTIFEQIGASSKALTISEPIIPDSHTKSDPLHGQFQHHTALIFILDFLRDTITHFSNNTREYVLNILFRLTLDASLTRNSIICSELERTIAAVLESINRGNANEFIDRICLAAHTTLKDAELQARLLEHMAPTNDWIASLRRRLGMIFLTNDPLATVGSADRIYEVRRVVNILKDNRFDMKRHKRNRHTECDYGELGAIITFLNIVIDSGWSAASFPDRGTEKEFDREIDMLADRIKKIFTAIEDSGASHLKRTLAKEALESLHYRILYSVRSRPPPQKALFGELGSPRKKHNLLKYVKKNDKTVTFKNETVS